MSGVSPPVTTSAMRAAAAVKAAHSASVASVRRRRSILVAGGRGEHERREIQRGARNLGGGGPELLIGLGAELPDGPGDAVGAGDRGGRGDRATPCTHRERDLHPGDRLACGVHHLDRGRGPDRLSRAPGLPARRGEPERQHLHLGIGGPPTSAGRQAGSARTASAAARRAVEEIGGKRGLGRLGRPHRGYPVRARRSSHRPARTGPAEPTSPSVSGLRRRRPWRRARTGRTARAPASAPRRSAARSARRRRPSPRGTGSRSPRRS